MADKPKLSVFNRTEATPPTGADVIDLEALIDSLDLAEALDDGNIRQTGVGLRQGEMDALTAIGADLGGVARNALLRTGARLVIALYRAGRLDLAGNVEEPPPQRKRFRQPGSKK